MTKKCSLNYTWFPMVDPQSRRTLVITMSLGLVWTFGHTILLRVLGTFSNIHTKLVVFMLHHFYNFYINLFLVLGTFWKNSHKAGPDQDFYIFPILWFQKFGKHFQNFNICFKFTLLKKSNLFPIFFVWKFVKKLPPSKKKTTAPILHLGIFISAWSWYQGGFLAGMRQICSWYWLLF